MCISGCGTITATFTVSDGALPGSDTRALVVNGTNDAPVIVGEAFDGYVMELGSNVDTGSIGTSGTFNFDDADLSDGHTVAVAPGTTMSSFDVGGSRYLEFRAEAFNLTNTPSFGPPGRNIVGAGLIPARGWGCRRSGGKTHQPGGGAGFSGTPLPGYPPRAPPRPRPTRGRGPRRQTVGLEQQAELVATRPHVLVTWGITNVRALARHTRTIPIVCGNIGMERLRSGTLVCVT